MCVTASLLLLGVLACSGPVAAVELQHKAGILQFAWYGHMAKTGGSALMAALQNCTPCFDGPAGQFVNQMDNVGLMPSVSTKAWNRSASERERQCANKVPHSAGLKCTAGSGGVDENVLCTEGILARNHHWSYNLVGKPLESLVRNAGYQPVVVGSTRNPFTYYLSHYFFALEQQHRTPYNGGGLPKFGPEHDVCLPVAERLGKACVAALRTWLRHRLLTKPMWRLMQHYYGSNATIVPSWAWVPKETLGPSIERILERITGRPLPGDALSCLRRRLTDEGRISDLEAVRPYYTRELIALVDHVDREIFERFNYSSLSTGVETLMPKEPAPTIHTELLAPDFVLAGKEGPPSKGKLFVLVGQSCPPPPPHPLYTQLT